MLIEYPSAPNASAIRAACTEALGRPAQAAGEAAKHGFRRAIVPAANAPRSQLEGLEVVPVRRLGEAIDAAFG